MKNSQLNRVLQLVRHTGDRIVIMDPETDEVIVMMRLPEYEEMIGVKQIEPTLAENLNVFDHEDRFDKNWHDILEESDAEDEEMEKDFNAKMYSPDEHINKDAYPTLVSESHDTSVYPWEEEKALPRSIKKLPSSANLTIPPEDSLNFDDYDWDTEEGNAFTEESLNDLPEEEEEERFYLEPIE